MSAIMVCYKCVKIERVGIYEGRWPVEMCDDVDYSGGGTLLCQKMIGGWGGGK